ncbi:SH3 domain-containing protein [Fredinandcohnia onubensis]|uniref:SH3 domain-containing protein n=1 Tax=Fredinandcohnia onubensis TaxID=1571209 RepID=UPI000C0BD56C|nr:SH3 domain-containing protein [Fredinandcohnia onubensis]
MKGKNRIISVLSIILMLVASPVFAEDKVITSENNSLIEAIVDTPIFTEDGQKVGTIVKGVIVSYSAIDSDKVTIQWKSDIAYINKENTRILDSVEVSDSEMVLEGESNSIGTIVAENGLEVLNPKTKLPIFQLEPKVKYPVIGQNDGKYKVLIGSRLGIIEPKDDVTFTEETVSESVIEPSNQTPDQNSTDNSSEEITNPNLDTGNLADKNAEVIKTEQTPTSEQLQAEEEKQNSNELQSEETEVVEVVGVSENEPKPRAFTLNDRYFKANADNLSVYDNSTGKLVHAGYLIKGQVYPRVSDYGDWHKIKYGNGYGYVLKSATIPVDGPEIRNENSSNLQGNGRTFTALENLVVNDNTSGALIPFAVINKGTTYPIIGYLGPDWIKVDVSGRIGYVYKSATKMSFESSDRYFKADVDNLSVYDNSTGKLVHIGYLIKGQVFPRVSDYGDWHRIKYGNTYGFVWKDATSPAIGTEIKNENSSNLQNNGRTFTALENLVVNDNTSGALVPFAVINKGTTYPVLGYLGPDWIKVDVGGRIGYVYKPATKFSFENTDRYFKVDVDNLSVYDNSTGRLVHKGYLIKGQVFPRVSDYGDWHKVKYGNGYGFIWKDATSPAVGTEIRNENTSNLQSNGRSFTAIENLVVNDNTSGALVPFAVINSGSSYPILGYLGSEWIKVDVGGRIGYVYKSATKMTFESTDRYFKASIENLPIYDNSTGKLVHVGNLMKGQVYPRVSDYGDWHQIKFGRGYGYVWEDATEPAFSWEIKNENTTFQNTERNFKALENLVVNDNTSGALIPFATINAGTTYPVVGYLGPDWIKIDVSGRIGYVYKPAVHEGPIYRYTNYALSLAEAFEKQMAANPPPQTDKKYKAYVRSDAFIVNDVNNPTVGIVQNPGWRVRVGPSISYDDIGQLNNGESVTILSKAYNTQDGYWWYEIKYNRQWVNAIREDVLYYLNPESFNRDSKYYYQFLVLSESAGISINEVNQKILANKGILSGHGKAFVEAGAKYGINELYLISHAILESGHGSSKLANGIVVSSVDGKPVTPRTVYNMYGVGAKDVDADRLGSEYAYQQGWFTPEAAIIGGAEFIANKYINNGKDTLYKMKWNPAAPGTYQYATDIGWAYKQVSSISNLYEYIDTYTLIFDIPKYR